MKFLRTANLEKYHGQICLLRVDLNIEPGQEESAYRLEAILPTIKFLLKNKTRIVLLSHRGRPKNKDRKYSLRPLVKILERKTGQKIIFLTFGNDFNKFKKRIKSSKNKIFLLENLRFWPSESQNTPVFAKKLAILGNFYVNEAFAVSHRKNASISVLPRFLPNYAGLRLEMEIKNLDLAMRHYKRPFTIIIGGAKASDKLGMLNYFINKADRVLLGGGPANTFLAAQSQWIGDSIFDKDSIPLVKKYLNNLKIILPIDFKISQRKILDIGQRTAEAFAQFVNRSKTVIWNGPMGLFEEKEFASGTIALWQALFKNKKARIIAGGGETTSSLKLISNVLKLPPNIFLSTGGGAMLDYLSGKKLPGIEALK